MTNSRFFRSNRWRSGWLAVGVAAGSILLLLALIPSAAQAGPAATRALPPVDREPAIVNNGPVITIGVAAALNFPFGWQSLNAAQLAISQTNAAGGVNIGGITYTLIMTYADGQCNPTDGAIAANALLNAGAVAIVGHSCSGESMAAQPIYSAQGVAMVSPSSTTPGVTEGGYTNTFRTIARDDTPAIMLATHFRNRLSRATSAIAESGWSMPGDVYSDTFAALGGTITSRNTLADASEFTTTLTAIQAENPDAIANFFLDADPNATATAGGDFSRIAQSLGMTDTLIGFGGLGDANDDALLATHAAAAGAAAEGDFAMLYQRRFADMPGWPTFLADYQAAGFASEPNDPAVFGAYAYDAANIIIAAIDRADSADPTAIRDEIAATSNYTGVVGTYQGFDAKGDVLPQWASMWRYLSGEWMKVHPSESDLPTFDLSRTDDFISTTLDSRWSWTNEDPTHWSLTARPGFLRITTQGGLGTGNLLLQDAPKGDFDIRTRMIFTPTNNFHYAGLVIYQDSNNFLILGRAFCGFSPPACVNGNGIYFDRTEGGAASGGNFATSTDKVGEAHLRVIRKGNAYSAYYSEDGVTWILIGKHTLGGVTTPTQVGLAAHNNTLIIPELPADFDFFTVLRNSEKVFLPVVMKNY